MNQPTATYPSFRRPLTPSKPNPNRDSATTVPGSGTPTGGGTISVALIWKVLISELFEKGLPELDNLTLLMAIPGIPVGVILGSEPRQVKLVPSVAVTYSQYFVPAVKVKELAGVKV